MDELIADAARVVGLYGPDNDGGRQLGFARVVSDGHTVSYLADVYVLEEARGRGLGLELVRFAVDEEASARRNGSSIRGTCTGSTRSSASCARGSGRWSEGEGRRCRLGLTGRLHLTALRPSVAAPWHRSPLASRAWRAPRLVSRSSTCSRARAIEIRSWASESRSRIVTVSSSSVCSSTVSPHGVPISSWRR